MSAALTIMSTGSQIPVDQTVSTQFSARLPSSTSQNFYTQFLQAVQFYSRRTLAFSPQRSKTFMGQLQTSYLALLPLTLPFIFTYGVSLQQTVDTGDHLACIFPIPFMQYRSIYSSCPSASLMMGRSGWTTEGSAASLVAWPSMGSQSRCEAVTRWSFKYSSGLILLSSISLSVNLRY